MNNQRLIDTFCELVRISSETPNDKEFVTYMENLFIKEGAKTAKDKFGNLVAKFPALNSNKKEYVAFGGHADTVKPGIGIKPIVQDGLIRSQGDTILGADDKGGIAEFLEAFRSAKKRPPLEFILTRCEERATEGSSNMDYSLVSSKMAYVIDEEEIDSIVIGAPTKFALYVEYSGVSAHASEPENGVSAIIPAAKAISMMKLGRIDHETTANVGIIDGGQVVNGIPDKVNIVAECRSCNHDKAVALAKEMERIFKLAADENNVKVNIQSEIKYYSFQISDSHPVVKYAIDAMSKNGITPRLKIITGGLDSNNFNRNGIVTATLGLGCRGIHTKEETAIVKDMEKITKAIIDLIESLA